jgi:hypothetical protein
MSCFSSILILFESSEAIQIDHTNVSTYKYLSEVLDNKSLWLACNSVTMNQPQLFYFSSERLSQISLEAFRAIQDFTIKIKDDEIKCNRIFASLISKKIFSIVQKRKKPTLIDFSKFKESRVLKTILRLLDGLPLALNEFDKKSFSMATRFIGFDITLPICTLTPATKLKTSDFLSQNFSKITEFHLLTRKSMKKILSSKLLHLKNENQLFQFIMEKLEENTSNLSLLRYSYGGYVLKSLIDRFIDIIELDHMKPDLFDFLKNCFEFGYFVSDESNTREILLASSFYREYCQLEKENHQLQMELDLLPKIEKIQLDPGITRGIN